MDIKGPFFIKNPSEVTIYLKVGPKSRCRESRIIDAITEEKDASRFYVKYIRENGQYFEIFYKDEGNQLFLGAARDDRHNNRNRTVQVGDDSGGAWSYLSLCNDKLKFIDEQRMNDWLEGVGSKAFAISCYVKPAQAAKRDESFLVIRQSTIMGRTRYSICCMSKSKIHHSSDSDLMRFQLVPAPVPPEDQQQQQHPVQQVVRTEAEIHPRTLEVRSLSVDYEIAASQ